MKNKRKVNDNVLTLDHIPWMEPLRIIAIQKIEADISDESLN